MFSFVSKLFSSFKSTTGRSYFICKLCGKDVPASRFCQCFCSDRCEQLAHEDGVTGPLCDC